MTINQMAWVASGMSFLAIAGANFLGTAWLVQPPIAPVDRHDAVALLPVDAPLIHHAPVDWVASQATVSPPSVSVLVGNPSSRPTEALPHRLGALDDSNALWRCPASLRQQLPTLRPGQFPVKMQGCVVAYLTAAAPAQQLSQQLDRLLQDPQTNWAEVMPHLVSDGLQPTAGHRLTIQRGDQLLLRLDPALAAQFNTHPHRLIADWANNIRLVAGQRPLSLTEAQKQLYAVAETADVSQGAASWYGPYFHGRMTANGEIYNQNDLTAAHRTLPLGTYVQVTNRLNGRSVIVRINDRGPYLDEDYRIIDLSYKAAQILDGAEKGVMPIDLVVMQHHQPQYPRLSFPLPQISLRTPRQTPPQTIALGPLNRNFQDQ